MSRAKTANELSDEFLAGCRALAFYWAGPLGEEISIEDRLMGLLHSVLTMIDGYSSGFPCALDLVCRPHPDDKKFDQEDGLDWVKDGTVINSGGLLHDRLYNRADQ